MKRFLCLLIILVVTSFSLIAQHGFKEGYILKTHGDTIYGLIENRSYYENSLICNFKKSSNDPIIQYKPSDIFGYRFKNDKYYISKVIKNERFFFEYLLKGKLNVYLKQSADLGNQYYIDKDSLPMIKLQYLYETPSDENSIYKINETSGHNLVLANYTSDYPPLRETALNMMDLNARTLKKFAETYHNAVCKDQICTIYKKTAKIKMEVEINGGVSHYFEDKKNPSPRTFYTSGPVFSLMVPQVSESIYFGLGLNFNYLHPQAQWIKTFSGFLLPGDSLFTSTRIYNYKTQLQVPLYFYYKNHRPGFSPILGFSTNVLQVFNIKALGGVSYQLNSFSIKLYGEYELVPNETNSFLNCGGVKFGIGYLIK